MTSTHAHLSGGTGRAAAAKIVLVLVTAFALGTLVVPSADAAKKPRFIRPTDYTYVRTQCQQVKHDTWRVTYVWKVRGGRYTNYGDGSDLFGPRDNVRRGGTRIVRTVEHISGWPGLPGKTTAPATVTPKYYHVIGPLKASPLKFRQNRGSHPEVKVRCS